MALLILMRGDEADALQAGLTRALAPYPVFAAGDRFDPESIRYALTWQPEPGAFNGLVNLKAILSYGAGVDVLMRHPALPEHVPVVRFVDPDLSQRMSEYVVAEVTRHHRLDSTYRTAQRARSWIANVPRRADEIVVGIMGLGTLGRHAASSLTALGYAVRGWSRSPKNVDAVTCFAGPDALDAFLGGTDILVNLLPLTPDTAGILSRKLFEKLRRGVLEDGPAVINAARGGHLITADLLDALADGTLGAASLDVFDPEPLAADDPLWSAPNCYITPHVAAISDTASLVAYLANVIKRHEAGAPLENLVDRSRGY